jgi:glycine/D-amino acid oxidase-like deaminating enzyme
MALPDVVIIGAGVVGAACAYYAAHSGLSVTVLDRGSIAGGTTAAGQGTALAGNRPPGPVLDLAIESLRRWEDELAAELGAARMQLSRTPALAVARTEAERRALTELAAQQRSAGLDAVEVPADELRDHEPLLAPDLAGGVVYSWSLQLDPVLATAHLLRASGAEVRCGVDVRGVETDGGMRVTGVRTAAGERLGCAAVVNAAGVWAGEVSRMVGTPLPVTPRRGFVLVTEALGVARRPAPARGGATTRRRTTPPIKNIVYAAGYADTITSDDAGPQLSTVVTCGRAGAVFVGASRERVGFDRSWPLPLLRQLAAGAVRLFPFLGDVSTVRVLRGFRPDTPDRLPIIGPDPWITGLFHACGHEGAGICLAPATGALTAKLLAAGTAPVELFPFDPERFG